MYNFFPPRKVVHIDLKRLAFLTVGLIFNWKGAIESGDARRHNGGRNSIQLHLVRFLERSEVLYASYAENLMVYNFFPTRKVVHHDLKRLSIFNGWSDL